MNHLDRYQSLLDGYHQGLYTAPEVVGQMLDMLAVGLERAALWQALTQQHREEIASYLMNYDETAPPLLPHAHWRQVKENTIALKRWLEDQ